MTEQDLSRFLHKVDQLQQLVQSLEDDEQRRQSLAACTNHNQVVALSLIHISEPTRHLLIWF